MFGSGKKKVEESKSHQSTGSSSHYQNSTVNVTGTSIEQRTVSRITRSTSYSTSVIKNQTNIELRPSRPVGTSALINRSIFDYDTPAIANSSKYRSNSVPQCDATPFQFSVAQQKTTLKEPSASNVTGYQSPFSRRLPAYNSARSAASSISSSTRSLPTAIPSEGRPIIDPRIPTYDTNGKKRGRVLVINNIKFLSDKEERKGAEKDEKDICNLFKAMGFKVESYTNLKRLEMINRVKRFKNDSSFKSYDMSIVIMMSHGNNQDQSGNVVIGGFTQIFGSDGQGLPIEDVLNEFSSEKCPSLQGKPKIFLFQCCRGSRTETLHKDAAPIKNAIKSHADMLIAFSTLPGFDSLRHPIEGSWYIQSVCEVFKNHAKDFHIEEMLKIVDSQLSGKHPNYFQTSMYENRGFKRCYLNPKS